MALMIPVFPGRLEHPDAPATPLEIVMAGIAILIALGAIGLGVYAWWSGGI